MAQDDVTVAQRRGESRLSRAKDGDDGHAEQRCEMHRARVVGEQNATGAQFFDELLERRLSDPIYAIVSKRGGDGFANGLVAFCTEQNPLGGQLRSYCGGCFGETLG